MNKPKAMSVKTLIWIAVALTGSLLSGCSLPYAEVPIQAIDNYEEHDLVQLGSEVELEDVRGRRSHRFRIESIDEVGIESGRGIFDWADIQTIYVYELPDGTLAGENGLLPSFMVFGGIILFGALLVAPSTTGGTY